MALRPIGREATAQVDADMRQLRDSLSRTLLKEHEKSRRLEGSTVFTRFGAENHEWTGYFFSLTMRQLFYGLVAAFLVWIPWNQFGGFGFNIAGIPGNEIARWLLVASFIATWLLSGRKRLRRWGWFITSPILLAGLAVLHVVFFR